MKNRALGIAAAMVLAAGVTTYAQPGAAPNPAPRPGAPALGEVGKPIIANGGGPGIMWSMGRGPAMSWIVGVITDLNMSPDFTLTPEQKIKIAAARDEFAKAFEAWQKEHQDEISKLNKGMGAAYKDQDKDAIAEAQKAQNDLYKTAPQVKDMEDKIMAVLTDAQKKAVQDAMAKRREVRMEERPMNKPR